jgi:hypothetical protein
MRPAPSTQTPPVPGSPLIVAAKVPLGIAESNERRRRSGHFIPTSLFVSFRFFRLSLPFPFRVFRVFRGQIRVGVGVGIGIVKTARLIGWALWIGGEAPERVPPPIQSAPQMPTLQHLEGSVSVRLRFMRPLTHATICVTAA